MGRSRKNRIPRETSNAEIESLAHDGRGIAHIEGKATFIHGALPGEHVSFQYHAVHRRFDEGRVVEVLKPSPDRVEPQCPHFGLCGGCSLQHLGWEKQVEFKQQGLLENLSRIGKTKPHEVLPPLTAGVWGYRRKARLSVKYVIKKERLLVGFRERGKPYVADIDACEVLDPRVGKSLDAIADMIASLTIVRCIPQIEVAAGDNAIALSFRVLSDPTDEDKQALIEFGRAQNMQIYLQPKGPDSTYLLYPKTAKLEYRLEAFDLNMTFQPWHFTQVNYELNIKMLNRAMELLDLKPDETVLDLFCGLGNFSLPIARAAGKVVGVEGDQALVDWAKQNARNNGINNAEFHVADLSADQSIQSWMAGQYDKVLLDPPRTGAIEFMPHLIALKPHRIVYVSCHPATLARDTEALVKAGYRLQSAGIMDMFPHTAHVESIALFEKI